MHSADLVTKSTLSSVLAESLCSAALKAAPTSDSLLLLVRFHSVSRQLLGPPFTPEQTDTFDLKHQYYIFLGTHYNSGALGEK